MSGIPTTTDYGGRQVDLELLQSVTTPSGEQQVHLTSVGNNAKIVSGIEKAIQRYAVLLLSTIEDIHFAPEQGGELISGLTTGRIHNLGYLYHVFGMVNGNTLMLLARDDDAGIYGAVPDDERVTGAELVSAALDASTRTINLTVRLATAAGSNFTFVVPINTME